MTILDELSESTKLDGAGHFMIFSRIVLPLSFAAISAVIIFTFVGSWNQYETALIYLREKHLATIPLGMIYFRDENTTSYGAIMAGTVCALIPIFAVFLTFRKQFVAGIATTGLKE